MVLFIIARKKKWWLLHYWSDFSRLFNKERKANEVALKRKILVSKLGSGEEHGEKEETKIVQEKRVLIETLSSEEADFLARGMKHS